MTRRRRKKLSVSLFPFLSVLACVIGTLTLMITALALGQMDTDEMASAVRLDFVKRQIEDYKNRIEALRKALEAALENADDTQKRLAETRAELKQLELEKKLLLETNDEKPKPEIKPPKVDEDAHKKRMEELAEELKQRQQSAKELEAEIKKRKKPPEEAEVIIQPTGSGTNLEPSFVECASGGIVLHTEEPPRRVHANELDKDEGFLALLDKVAKQPRGTVIFLVRDDGLGTYYKASALAREHYTRNGKLPVIGHGKIDLKMFQK